MERGVRRHSIKVRKRASNLGTKCGTQRRRLCQQGTVEQQQQKSVVQVGYTYEGTQRLAAAGGPNRQEQASSRLVRSFTQQTKKWNIHFLFSSSKATQGYIAKRAKSTVYAWLPVLAPAVPSQPSLTPSVVCRPGGTFSNLIHFDQV